jgi:hypothetical protein
MHMENGGGGPNDANGVPSAATTHFRMLCQRLLATRSFATLFAQARNGGRRPDEPRTVGPRSPREPRE